MRQSLTLNLRSFIAVVLVNFAVQYLAFRYFRIFDIAPDLTLLFVLYLNLSFSGITGLIAAFALGLYQDIFFHAVIGGHSIAYLLVAYVANRLLAEKIELSVFRTLLFAVYFSLLCAITYQALSAPAWGITLFWKPIIFSVYNGAWSLPAFYLYHRELA